MYQTALACLKKYPFSLQLSRARQGSILGLGTRPARSLKKERGGLLSVCTYEANHLAVSWQNCRGYIRRHVFFIDNPPTGQKYIRTWVMYIMGFVVVRQRGINGRLLHAESYSGPTTEKGFETSFSPCRCSFVDQIAISRVGKN